MDAHDTGPECTGPERPGPERQARLADSVGLALLAALETLTPAERLAFVLHDLFSLPSDAIAPLVGGGPAAARHLVDRARRRVRGTALPLDD
ncbi:sigma factor-like helix-turn-helix DNA-binding protein [Streptomyces sp. NPDC059008]|uniref:sigma factor-like helix-turn-helix DNA-binding protein n=1 Tax=Streptomyces sp. NPDC059008 TaxID=3346693 RepID=UPI0036ADC9F3